MTETTKDDIINTINTVFVKYVKKGLFGSDFIGSDKEYYSAGRCHSRVLGILVGAIQSIGYIADIERSIKFDKPYKPQGRKRAMHQFRPDIAVVNNNDNIVGIIEYETIDASEEHLNQKIEYFELSIPANRNFEFLIYFPTLTTLQRAPAPWVEQNRQEYVKPIFTKIKRLSKLYPHIKFYFLDLNERGLSSRSIKGGNTAEEQVYKIFEGAI